MLLGPWYHSCGPHILHPSSQGALSGSQSKSLLFLLPISFSPGNNTNIYVNTQGYAVSFTALSNVSGLEYVMMAKGNNNWGYTASYITDTANFSSNGTNRIIFGGNYDKDLSRGLFSINGIIADNVSSADVGSRLMVLPPNRLSA